MDIKPGDIAGFEIGTWRQAVFPGDGGFIRAGTGGGAVHGLGGGSGGRRLGRFVFELHRIHAPVGRQAGEKLGGERQRAVEDQGCEAKQDGRQGTLSTNTPRHRLIYWLEQIDTKDSTKYGFHSLRAGGASEAARAGVHERDIKQHGNWASDAVRVYLTAGTEERLHASDAIAQALNKLQTKKGK